MTDPHHAMPPPIDAVLLDFNHTIARVDDIPRWLTAARRLLDREPASGSPDGGDPVIAFLADIWGHARTIDPTSQRDLSAEAHRSITLETITGLGGIDDELAGALYDVLPRQWELYDEAPRVLRALQEHGIPLAVLSNIGLDIRPCLADGGVLDLLDAVVLSYEVGLTKPDPAIFEYAVRALGADPSRTLMVGDTWHDDAGGTELGIRTLILPSTTGPDHGLEAVLRLTGVTAAPCGDRG